MESLAHRTALALSRHPSPAVPFGEAVRLARATGMPVTEAVLLRSLRAEPELFRVLAPWREPWATSPAEPWLVPLQGDDRDSTAPASLRRLRTSLVWLGRTVDDRSKSAMARWFSLVREAERVRRAAG
ncbi:MAG: hypothetical protein KY453_03615 [Gemmatimonadetes bacterium]|nr:hypothetical protein [Gemmatimonadota bacterium]